jgi:HPt (histidine-containing phosphotransfer) domain-containing protein
LKRHGRGGVQPTVGPARRTACATTEPDRASARDDPAGGPPTRGPATTSDPANPMSIPVLSVPITASLQDAPQPFDGDPPTAAQTRARALARFDDDAGFLEQIVPLFRQAAIDQARSLGGAMDSGDAPKVQHWAHTLKGSLLTVGATQTAVRAERIERAAAEGRLAGLDAQVRQVVAETVVIVAQLGGDPAAIAG